ncbi:protein IWS1 homolog [Polyergus mexicanus]|uniref:protein IWS1 homolog n=1 Tax=Polyergus mexicanus TaxID=615972 RepID=UPI0038B4EDD7
MRKAFSVLALIAFACDISRDPLVHGDPAGNPEVAGRSDDYECQKEPNGQFDDTEVPQRSMGGNREQSPSEPVGKWRSNGEALEPKWRDGDYIPLLPFSRYRSYTRDEIDDAENFSKTNRRPFEYRYTIDQSNPRGSPDSRGVPSSSDYDQATYRSHEDHPRDSSTLDEETIESAASNDGKRSRNIVDVSVNNDREASRYHEAFQARPDEYEHEFNDEEYMKPRPRKRRPPQNYEFALANEASSNEENEESRDASQFPLSESSKNLPVMTRSSDNERKNALELKSLLKMQQEEGSSLSETLQRRNLSLSDLLKGKADVINALKSRIADESDEYIEEMSRVMSDSLMMKLATVTPPWRSMTTENTNIIKITAASSTLDNSISRVIIVPHEVSENYDEVSSNDTNRIKEKSNKAENIATQSVRDSSWRRMASTTPPIVSTVITTSTTSPPIAVNSMEYFLNDDGNAGSTSDRAAKFENLDEDEIMEFSDFTNFKKGKSPTKATSERIASQSPARDTESTLSIEQILNSTERIEPIRYRQSDQGSNTKSNSDKKIIQDQSIPIGEPASTEDYNTFIEAEYQNDAPIPEEDHGKQNKVMSNPSASQTRVVTSPVEKKQTANPDDDIKKLYDKNRSTEYHQVSRSPMEKIRNHASLKNHQGADSRRYEEVISEIEPEARAEIFELFASGSAGKRLERLLKSRNMSVEELIALRQRGSSKVHLTEMSRLRVTKPQNNLQTLETSNTNNEDIIIQLSSSGNSNGRISEGEKISEKEGAKREKAEESMTQFIKQDIIGYLDDPFFDKNVKNMSMSRLLDLVERDKNASRGTFPENDTLNEHNELQNSHRTVQIVDLFTTFDSLPFVKDVQRQFDTAKINNNEFEPKLPIDNDNASVVLVDEDTKIVEADNSSGQFHAGYVKEIAKEEPNVIEIKTIYGETMSDGEERKTLSQMKPSIIASGAILGVTIVVFLAIFIVCRIRQKRKYTYRNTFSRAMFQNPVMMARKLSNSSSLSTVMVNVVATSTTKRPERTEMQETVEEFDGKSDIDNDSLDGNDSWETIPDYAK